MEMELDWLFKKRNVTDKVVVTDTCDRHCCQKNQTTRASSRQMGFRALPWFGECVIVGVRYPNINYFSLPGPTWRHRNN